MPVQIPHLGIDGALGGVGNDLDREVLDAVFLQKPVALADDAALALLDVRWLPCDIDVVQRDKAVLYVCARTHAWCGPDQDPDIPVLHLLEQLRLLLVVVGGLDKGNLVFGNTFGHQPGLDVIVCVPAAIDGRAARRDVSGVEFVQRLYGGGDLRLVVGVLGLCILLECGVVIRHHLLVTLRLRYGAIEEHDLRPLVGIPFPVDAQEFPCDGGDLAAFRVRRIARIDGARVERDLARPVHEAQALGVALLDVGDIRQTVEPLHHLVEDTLRRWPRRDRHKAAGFAIFDVFDTRDRERRAVVVFGIGEFDVVDRDRIGNAVVEVHQRAHVGPFAAQAHNLLEPTRFGRLPFGGRCHEHGPPCVEVLKAHFAQLVRHKIAQHQIHFRDRVGDRRACQEGGRVVGVVQGPHLHVQVHRLLRPGLVAHTCGVRHARRVGKVLEFVRLIDRQVVNAHLLEIDQAVAGLGAQFGHALLELVDQALGLGHAHRLAPAAVGAILCGLLFRFLDGVERGAQFLLKVLLLDSRVDRDHADLAVPDDDAIIVPGSDAGEHAATVGLLKIGLPGDQQLCAGVERGPVLAPLLGQVVGNSDQRLAGQPHAAAFHDPRDGGEGLARADNVIIEDHLVGDAAPDGIVLVAAHPDRRVLAGQFQVRPVPLPGDARVVLVVEDLHELVAAVVFGKHPILKLVLQFLGLLLAFARRVFIHDRLFAVAIRDLVGHADRAGVHHGLEDLDGRPCARFGRLPFHLWLSVRQDGVGVGQRLIANVAAGKADVAQEVRIDLARYPVGTQRRRDFCRSPRFRRDLLKRLDVALERSGFGCSELAADLAGQVFVGGNPFRLLWVKETPRGFPGRKRLLDARDIGAQERGHAVEVEPARFREADRDRVVERLGGSDLCRREQDAPGQDVRVLDGQACGVRLGCDVLDSENETAIRHLVSDRTDARLVQRAVGRLERAVCLCQLLAVGLYAVLRRILAFQFDLSAERIADRQHVPQLLDTRSTPLGRGMDRREVFNDLDLLDVQVGLLAIGVDLFDLRAGFIESIDLAPPLAVRSEEVGVAVGRVLGDLDFLKDGVAIRIVLLEDGDQASIVVQPHGPWLRAAHGQPHGFGQGVKPRRGALRDGIPLGRGRDALNGGIQALLDLISRQGDIQFVLLAHRAGGGDVAQHHGLVLVEIIVHRQSFAGPGRVVEFRHVDPLAEVGFQPLHVACIVGAVLRLFRPGDARQGGICDNRWDTVLAECQDVGDDLCARVFLKRGVRQTDCTLEGAKPGQRPAIAGVLGIHQVAADNHRHEAIGRYSVHRSLEKLVVDALAVHGGQVLEIEAVRSERRVADGKGKLAFRQGRILKPGVIDHVIRIELLCDPGGDAVIFDGHHLALAAQGLRHQPEKVPGAGRWLQHRPTVKTKALCQFPDALDNRLRRVMGGAGRIARGFQFFGLEQGLKLADLGLPALGDISGPGHAERVFQTTPADISGKDLLFGGSSRALFGLDPLERFDGSDVVVEFLGGATLTKAQIIGDDKALQRRGCRGFGAFCLEVQRGLRAVGLQLSGAGYRSSLTTSSASCSCIPIPIIPATRSAISPALICACWFSVLSACIWRYSFG